MLTPGKHKLTLQFANALHKRCGGIALVLRRGGADAFASLRRSYGKGYSKTISVNVK